MHKYIYYELPTDGDDMLLDVRAVDARLSPNGNECMPDVSLNLRQGLHFMAPGATSTIASTPGCETGTPANITEHMHHTIIQYRENAIKFVIPLARYI
jgi:hypothetical protein